MLNFFGVEETVKDLDSIYHRNVTLDDSGLYVNSSPINSVAEKSSLILVHRHMSGKVEWMIGFFVDNGSFAVYDPDSYKSSV